MKKMKMIIPAFLILFSAVMVFAPGKASYAATSSNAITRINLKGAAPISASHGTLLGHTNQGRKITATIDLQLRNTDQLKQFLKQLNDPSSPNYKKFLTPAQFTAQYGPSAADIAKVVTFAKSFGLQVVSNNGALIKVSGTMGQMEKAFQVTINNYTNKKGQTYFANANTPQIPSNLSNIILNIAGLNNEALWHHHIASKGKTAAVVTGKANQPHVGSGPTGGYTPTELRNAYDVTPLSTAGYDGTGQSVALFELDGFVQSNITTYNNYYSLGSPTPSTVLVDGYNGSAGAGQGEVELDIEVVNAIAPKANVAVYEGPNTNQGVIDTYQKIATDNTSKVISSSWGICEQNTTSAEINSMDSVFQQMASQGQSIFAAAGDSGAYDCGNGSTSLQVDNPADDPYVTGVGGTNLTLSGSSYGSESIWSNTSNKTGGGGGLSTFFTQPTYQSGPGVSNSYSNGNREVPDVSGDADPATGYSIYSAGSWVVYGGTSCAAPLWAGITALNNQYAAANGKANLGQANPTLYTMFNTTQTYTPYHDITSGSNLYYPATSGYDLASGIGTPDVYNLIRDINGSTTGGGGGTTTDAITNGGFESGSTSWTESSSGGYELVTTNNPHTGSDSAWLCGYNNCTDTIYQTVSIPSTATTATLSYWTDVTTQETTHSYDFLYVQIENSSGTVLSTLQTQSDATATGWTKNTFDVSSYAGQTIRVYFKGTNDVSNVTNFYIDDVSLTHN